MAKNTIDAAYERNLVSRNERTRRWKMKNKERVREKQAQWRANNKEHIADYAREYNQKRPPRRLRATCEKCYSCDNKECRRNQQTVNTPKDVNNG